MLGAVLLVTVPIVTLTGLLSYIAYAPQLGQAIPGDVGWLKLPVFDWPTRPVWLYQLTQGVHVVLGLVIIPVVVAKLWSVAPKLFAWPPSRSLAHSLERISLLMLVGGMLFEIVTGVLNIQYDYIFGFSFYTAHYYGAWVFIAGFVVHLCLKLPRMVQGLRSRSLAAQLRTPTSATRPEANDDGGLVAREPAPPTMSRRGALALVAGGSAMLFVLSAGQVVGGPFRQLAVLLPRGRVLGSGPNDFQVNRTAEAAGIDPAAAGEAWKLELSGGARKVRLDRAQLLAMEQRTADLPIACVEGWSTTQTWTGVPLRDLAALAGIPEPSSAHVLSLQQSGVFNEAELLDNQVLDPDSLLALRVNGAELSADHGYPARIMVPALPGVHNTKWVRAIEFRS
ncbi:molybdopterin-dependent oxidoreductase [Arthrobacter pigmenti]